MHFLERHPVLCAATLSLGLFVVSFCIASILDPGYGMLSGVIVMAVFAVTAAAFAVGGFLAFRAEHLRGKKRRWLYLLISIVCAILCSALVIFFMHMPPEMLDAVRR